MGEIEVSTFLNQPLKAEIEVLSARPGEVDDLLVSLASREAFDKAGLERPLDLTKLRFQVEKSEDGQNARILVTTKTPVREPFLNFLVEADWAKGRLLREFTVLLDPPHFAQQAARQSEPTPQPLTTAEAQPDSAAPSGRPRFAEPAPLAEVIDPEPEAQVGAGVEPIASSQTSAPAPRESSYRADPAPASGSATDAITVGEGDTLWSIASAFKDDAHSMAQVMLAMQATNPEAFGNDNINNLKVGSVLRAPDSAALDSLSKQQAYAQVLEQNGLWDDYLARRSGSASSGSPSQSAAAGQTSDSASEARLSLMAPGDGDSTSASLQNQANSEQAGQFRKQLALAEEELEAARLQNEDLKSRISDLEQQLEKFEELKKLVEIEDSALARLQQSAASEEPASEEEPGADMSATDSMVEQPVDDAGEVVPSPAMVEAAEDILLQDQMASEPSAMADMETAQESQPDADMSMESTVAGPLPAQVEESAQDSQSEPAIEQTQDDQITPAPPIIVTEAPSSGADGGLLGMLPSLSGLLADPIMLGGLGGIVVLLLVLLFLKRKKSSEESADDGLLIEEPQEESMVDEDATPVHVPADEDKGADESVVDEATLGDTAIIEPGQDSSEDEDPFGETAIMTSDDVPEMEQPAAEEEQDDVLNEIDVYLAYGLYDNAEDLLKDSLESSPDRADYRAKLLDTYFATKNRDSFVKEAEALKSLGSAADRYWDRVQIMGYELDPDNTLFAGGKDSELSAADLEYAKPETADFDVGSDEADELDLTGTDFDFGLDSEGDDFDAAATQVMDEKSATGEATDSIEDELIGDFDLPDLDEVDVGLDDDADKDKSRASADDQLDMDELDLSESEAKTTEENTDALQFDLPDDLDLSDTDGNLDVAVATDSQPDDFDSTGELDIDLDMGQDDGSTETRETDVSDTEEAPQSDSAADDIEDDIEVVLDDEPDAATDQPVDQATDELEDEDATMAIEADLEDAIDRSDDDISDEDISIWTMPKRRSARSEEAVDGADEDVSINLDEALEAEADGAADDLQLSDEALADELQAESIDAEPVESESAEPASDVDEIRIEDDQLAAAEEDIEAFAADSYDESIDMQDVSEIDIDMSEFEATGESPGFDIDEAILAEEVDPTAGLEKTGTFAPGDFADDDEQPEDQTYSSVSNVDDIEDLMLPDDVDEVSTKLDLARAFIDMGDAEGARSSLEEVLEEGNDEQKAEAQDLLDKIN